MQNVYVQTKNVRAFVTAMSEAGDIKAEPVLLVFYGQAGRGKTTVAQKYAVDQGAVYVRALAGWKSELWMLQDFCRELRIDPVPHRKRPCFEAITARLAEYPQPVIVDEADKLAESGLEWIRDMADKTFVPFALVGEKLLLHKMQKERRVWSRTVSAVEFGPITAQDVLFFAKQAAQLTLSADQAQAIFNNSQGDFRLAARDVRRLETIVGASGLDKVTDGAVAAAIKQGFRGDR